MRIAILLILRKTSSRKTFNCKKAEKTLWWLHFFSHWPWSLYYSKNVREKLNVNPYETRGEEILTKYEDDYKFHRYTNRYGNAFGAEFYTISITCKSILTDPEVHQRLHDDHYDKQSRYYGYWYGQDLFSYDSQYEATKTNALIESSLAGSVLNLLCLIGQVSQ